MNIDEMQAGRELDVLIAEKIMGWVRISWDGAMCAPGSLVEQWMWRLCSPEVAARLLKSSEHRLAIEDDLPAKKYWKDDISDYSTIIVDAWQVVEKTNLFKHKILAKNEDGLYIICESIDIGVWPEYYVGASETVPLAICRAALKAMGEATT